MNEKRLALRSIVSPKAIIVFTVFLDVLGIGLVIPTLAFYVESFGVSQNVISALFAVFSLCAFISSPILGMISDRFGRRPVLLASLASSAIGWLIFGLSGSIIGLFIGRIIDGLAAGNISTAQNYLIDISKNDKERSHNLGLIGATFGIAFILGPLAGGLLSHISPAMPFYVVGVLATLNLILAYLFLPESHHDHNQTKLSLNPFTPIIKALKNKKLRPMYFTWFLFGIAISATQAIFALYLNERFSWTALNVGLIMALIGVIISINQAFLLKKFWLKYFDEAKLNMWVILPFAACYILMAAPYKFVFMLGIVISAFGQSLLRVTMTSQTINNSLKHEQGETLGILTSLMSLSMVIAPLIGGLLYGYDITWPYIFSAVVLILAFIVVWITSSYIKTKGHTDTPIIESV
ncbi:MAG: MFS transporter [Candidatus Pacebacteria bacterium]|nr:MFS transporter [Candidatus Paceibacterota bacterium]